MGGELGKQRGKILYFDPNNVTVKGDVGDNITAIFDGLEVMKDPEEYCIAVDLEVVNKNRSVTKIGNLSVENTKDASMSNFLMGSDLNGSKVLTTYFDNITYDGSSSENVNEAMSIESIDIEFSSWYVASVIIKFVDVRGASLFSTTEKISSENNSNQTKSDGNLFSGFFTMPYPIFNLKIKGFYGDAVTYPLHCSDFKAEFNNEKGNFDITAHFIGYTYAMLSDIQMTFLMSAPYTDLGKTYWENQVKNDRFTTFEGNPLSKIPELLSKIKKGEKITSEIKGSNEIVKSLETLQSENASIENIKSLIDSDREKLTNNKSGYWFKEEIETKYKFTTASSTVNLNFGSSTKFVILINDLSEMVNKHINTFPSSMVFDDKLKNTDKKIQLDNIRKLICPNTPIKNLDGTWSGYVDFSILVNNISNFQIDVKKNSDNLVRKISSTVSNSLNSTYGMVPSIYNYIKLLLAHMETLLHIISKTAIMAEAERGVAYTNGNSKTDIKDNRLSPFCWLTVDGKDEWMGNIPEYSDYPEVKLVKSFILAQDGVGKELKKIEQAINTSESISTKEESVKVDKIWLPINAFDNSISDNGIINESPYLSLIKDSGLNKNDLKALLSSRIATILALSAGKYATAYRAAESGNIDLMMKFNKEGCFAADMDAYAHAEAINITNAIDSSSKSEVVTMLNEISGLTKNTTKLNLLRENAGYYEYNPITYPVNRGTLPLVSDSPEKLLKKIYSIFLKSDKPTLPYYKDVNSKYLSGKLTYYKSTNTKIINGRENCEYIYKNWYEPVKVLVPKNSDQERILNYVHLENEHVKNAFIDPIFNVQPLLNRATLKMTVEKDYNDKVNQYFGSKLGVVNEANKMPIQLNLTTGATTSINSKISFNSNVNFNNNIYSLYTGKSILEPIGDKDLELISRDKYTKSSDISNLTYPMIGGWYKETYISLFGSPFYYAQGLQETKAFLFLQTLPIEISSGIKLIASSNSSFMARTSLVESLLLGSMLWRKKYIKETGNDIFNSTKNVTCTAPDENSYFRNKDKIFTLSYEISFYDKCEGLDLISESISNKLISLFKNWVSSDNTEHKGWNWSLICDNFELRPKSGGRYNSNTITNLIKDINSNYSMKVINENILPSVVNNYITIEPFVDKFNQTLYLINKDGSVGVNAVLKLLNEECIIQYTGDGSLILNNGRTDITINNVHYVISQIISYITNIYNKTTTEKLTPEDITAQAVNNEGVNIETYRYLKTLYDKWVSGYDFDREDSDYKWINSNKTRINGLMTHDVKKFKFIDRSYNNIGDKFIIDINKTFESLLGQGDGRSLYSSITEALSTSQFLFLPMPNYQKWDTADNFAKIFQPMSYANSIISDNNEPTPLFLCMYTGTPSKSLSINSSEYMYSDDSLNYNLYDNSMVIPTDANKKVEGELSDTIDKNSLDTIPTFAVSYGKQNQSYFKKIALNMANPTTTEASIGAIKSLLDKGDKDSGGVAISQNLYNIYSKYAYTCNIEMLGCAQIQPMMYFQLTNIPMWNGAYLIYKVNHSIRPGNMTTNITGMRMGSSYPKLLQQTVIGYNTLRNNSFNIAPESKEISTLSIETAMGTGGHFKLKHYITKFPTEGKEVQSNIPVYIVERIDHNLAPCVDSIYDSWMVSDNGKKYGEFRINTGYRNEEENRDAKGVENSAHLQGLAVDIQLRTPSSEGNIALFEHIKGLMRSGLKIDELIKEVNGGKNGGWCHVSPANVVGNMVRVSGDAFHLDSRTNKGSDHEIIENARAEGKLLTNSEGLQGFINHWSNAEAGGRENFYDNLWHSYLDKGNIQTIAYGLQLPSSSDKFKSAVGFKQNNPSNLPLLTCTDEDALFEVRTRVERALVDIKRQIDGSEFQVPKGTVRVFDKINNEYRYCLVEIYLRMGSGKFLTWANFIDAVCNNNKSSMLKNCKGDGSDKRRDSLFEAYINGL